MAYGNSVFNPINIFSDLSPEKGLRVRIDDKLKRIMNDVQNDQFQEDTLLDLIGYLILLRILTKETRKETK
jgi:hypothetical protein